MIAQRKRRKGAAHLPILIVITILLLAVLPRLGKRTGRQEPVLTPKHQTTVPHQPVTSDRH